MEIIYLLMLMVYIWIELTLFGSLKTGRLASFFSTDKVRLTILGLILGLSAVSDDDRVRVFAVLCIFIPYYLLKRHTFLMYVHRQYAEKKFESQDMEFFLFLADGLGMAWKCFYTMLGISLVFVSMRTMFAEFSAGLAGALIFMFLFYAVLMAFMYQLARRYPRVSLKTVIAWHSNQQSLLKLVVIPALAGVAMAVCLSLSVINRNHPSTPMSSVLDTTTSSEVLMLFFAMVFLLGPLMEEIAFRGFYYHVIRKVMGSVFAFFFIVAVFAILHVEQYWGDWLAIFVVAMLGVMLTLCRIWTGSCIASTVMHACYNGAMVIVPVVLFSMTYPEYFEYHVRYHELNSVAKKELLLKSVEHHPHHADTYYELSRLYGQEQEDWRAALKYIDQALSYDERRYLYLDQKAEVLLQLGRVDEAIAIEEEIVEQFPAKKYKIQLKRFQDARESFPLSQPFH